MLGAIGIWLDEETIKQNMPEVFANYADTHIILDCTELHCQMPDSLLLQSEMYSSYKSHPTYKGLIGIAPHGAVTFFSPLYEGGISDKEIPKQSGLVSLLKPSMATMVDKGFLWCPARSIYLPKEEDRTIRSRGQEDPVDCEAQSPR